MGEATGVGEWIDHLCEAGILRSSALDGGSAAVLQSPFSLDLPRQAVGRLIRNYRSDVEIGGVLGARPTIRDGHPILSVRRVILVRNRSPTPWKEYLPDSSEFSTALGACLAGTSRGTRYFPVTFHSHPARRDDFPDHLSYFSGYYNLETSHVDRCSSELVWDCSGRRVVFPSALVCRPDEKMFIGAFGGVSAEASFREPMLKNIESFITDLGKGALEATEGDTKGRILAALGIVGLGALSLMASSVPGGLQLYASQLSGYGLVPSGGAPFAYTNGKAIRLTVAPADQSHGYATDASSMSGSDTIQAHVPSLTACA